MLPGPWLGPAFERKGYRELADRISVMRQLIDRYNRVLAAIVEAPEFDQHIRQREVEQGVALCEETCPWGAAAAGAEVA